MSINVEFTGGCEALFPTPKLTLPLPSDGTTQITMSDLIIKLRDEHLTNRPELFCATAAVHGAQPMRPGTATVRPGILVLVDDTDWEILGGVDCVLEPGNRITFISTLHG
eukprot:PhM_4_TR204/c0_g1_i1/m.22444/K12161/URM1; ubiquitin related modifier 1